MMTGATPDPLAGRRVLVIEDEIMVTMLLEDRLQELGCEVVGLASRYDDAMAKATSLAFDLALLDLNLAGRHTLPIAEAIAERGIAVVFATGYGAVALPAALAHAPVLQKPFRDSDFEAALRAALG